jgi:hypothetical protein
MYCKLGGGCLFNPLCINYSSQQIYTKSRIPPKITSNWLQVTYSTWLQQSGSSSWDGLQSTHMVLLTRVTRVGPGAPTLPYLSDQVLICLLVVVVFFLDFLKCNLNLFFSLFFSIFLKIIDMILILGNFLIHTFFG